MTPPGLRPLEALRDYFAAPRLTAALTTLGIAVSAVPFAIQRVAGAPTLTAMTVTLLLLMAASFAARLPELDWHGLLPVSLLAFLAWAVISEFFTDHQWATLGALLQLGGTTLMGLYIALGRDTVQIIRSMSDVLRVVLTVSLAIEVVSGILIDTPIPLLDIEGNIAELGPISGIVATRNQLGMLATIGAIGFITELRMRSVSRLASAVSLALALACILFTQSPIVWIEAGIAAVAAAAIYLVRRARPEARPYLQFGLVAIAAAAVVVGWALRAPLVALFNAGGQLEYRLRVWQQVQALIGLQPVEGWGWVGPWPPDLLPYASVLAGADRVPGSALNAFYDVWLQLGIVGLVLFVALLGLALVRSWLLAGQRRSTSYAWPALALLVLVTGAAAESSLLIEFGWLTFVICCVKASRELSWRSALQPEPPRATLDPEPPGGPS